MTTSNGEQKMSRKLKANQRIKAAMRQNERELLTSIKRYNRNGQAWSNGVAYFTMSTAWWNALKRLEAKGLVEYKKFKYCRGYWATSID